VRDTDGVDLVIVRENTEGEYVGAGRVSRADRVHRLGIEIAVYSCRVIERAAHHAFALAGRRSGYLCLVTKSNAMRYGHPLRDRVVREVGEHHPEVRLETVLGERVSDFAARRRYGHGTRRQCPSGRGRAGYPRTRPRLRTRHRGEGRGESGGMHAIRDAAAGTLRDARRHTADLGGDATTAEVATAVLQTMESQGYDT
jgi:tartrate dehydrogenase/decarboxylase/D-malate dehydrogenase